MLRWTIRILVVFLVLVLGAAVAVHYVLQSRWLGGLILAGAGDAIGMEVTADSVSVGWGGQTTIHNAAVMMPLTGDVVLAAERIEVSHAAIPLLIFGRPVNVRSVQVDRPQMNLRRYEDGRWNVQDVWTRVYAQQDGVESKTEISLPEVLVRDAEVHIAEPNGSVESVGPMTFRAEPQGGRLWQFDFQMPEAIGVQGQMVSGRDWTHEIGFRVDIEPLVHRLAGGHLTPIRATGRWEGKVLQGSLDGTLRLDALAVGSVEARGGIAVQAKSGELTLTAKDLSIREPNVVGREIRLRSGSVRMVGGQIRIEQLAAAYGQSLAQVDGNWDLVAQSGEFSGSWTVDANEQAARCNGTCRASVESPQFGRKTARVSIHGDAEGLFGKVAVAAEVEGDGSDWRQSQWRVSAPTLLWAREGREVNLAGASAGIDVTPSQIRLTDLHVPGAETTDVNAVFDPGTRSWSILLAVEDVPHLAPWGLKSLDLHLNAQGDDLKADISELRVVEGERVVTTQGRLSFHERGFQDVLLTADWPAGSMLPEQSRAEESVGRWHLEGTVFGRIQPTTIEMTGRMTGQNVSLGKQAVSRVEIPVRAEVNTEAVVMATDPVDLFGGQWQLSGRHDLSTNRTQIAATADALSLESVAAMAGLKIVSRGRTNARIEVAVQDFNIESAVATGSWDAEDVNIPPFQAERARGKLRIAGGRARFDEILLEREEGQVEAGVEFRLDDPRFLFVELTAKQWPVRFEGSPLTLYADAKANLRVDAVNHTADGGARLSGTVFLKEQELARVGMVVLAEEQTLRVEELHAETLGGTVEGQAEVRLSRWVDSSASLRWQGIQLKMLQPWAPQFERFEGTVSGFLQAEQVEDAARSPEPMRFVLNAEVDDGWFGSAAVDSCHITGYLGQTRLLVDEADLRALQGQMKARVRVSTHAGMRYGNIVADFNDLNLDQIVHVVKTDAVRHIGRLSGTASLLGSSAVLTKDFSALQGEAQIRLTKSDLGRNHIIGSLYNTLNLQFGAREPNGTGEVALQLEGPSLAVSSFSYFNRGVEVRGAGRINDLDRGSESPISGFAVGSTRVLKGINLPGMRSLDQLLTTFQTGAASVSIGGTLVQAEVKVVPLPVVLDPFRRLLWAQLRQR